MGVWRIVDSGMATLTEIETSWCYDDYERALAVLDFKGAIEKRATDILAKKGKHGNT